MIKKDNNNSNYKNMFKDGTQRVKCMQQELDEISKQLKIPSKTFTKFIKDANSDMGSPRKNNKSDVESPKFKRVKSSDNMLIDIQESLDEASKMSKERSSSPS